MFNTIALTLIIGVIMYSALNVAHHAEMLAEKYGEPYGTMILTLSAVLVEVLMIGIMMSHSENINLARDTIVSAVILDINGLFGLAAIIGGIKHGEQDFNFDSTNSYVSMLIVAIGIAMVSPLFITFNPIIMAVLFIFMFVVFTRIQTKEHSYFFTYDYKKDTKVSATGEYQEHNENINGLYHITILGGSIVVIGFLSELLSVFMDVGLKSSGLPIVLGAFAVAVISAAPELFTAIKSATEN
jgi:Ca2+:H+ antiporter